MTEMLAHTANLDHFGSLQVTLALKRQAGLYMGPS